MSKSKKKKEKPVKYLPEKAFQRMISRHIEMVDVIFDFCQSLRARDGLARISIKKSDLRFEMVMNELGISEHLFGEVNYKFKSGFWDCYLKFPVGCQVLLPKVKSFIKLVKIKKPKFKKSPYLVNIHTSPGGDIIMCEYRLNGQYTGSAHITRNL